MASKCEGRTKVLLLLIALSAVTGLKIDISKTQTTTEVPLATTTETTTVKTVAITSSSPPPSVVTADITKENESQSTPTTITQTPLPETSSAATEPSVNETQEEAAGHPEFYSRHLQSNYYCECDLAVNSCDINCCCDIDCTASAIKSFDCSADHHPNPPSYLSDYGLPPCSVSSSWFCVVNVDFKKVQTTHWSFDNSKRYKDKVWPESFPVSSPGPTLQLEIYRYNDDLLIFNEVTEDLESLRLPVSLYGPDCHFMESIRFLHNQMSKCKGGVVKQLQEEYLRNLSNWKVLSDSRFNSNMMSEVCTDLGSEFCIPFRMHICQESVEGQNCTLMNETWQMETIRISRVKFEFKHNFTNIKEAIIRINGEVSDDLDQVTEIQVEFVPAVKNNTIAFKASGNVGYIMGKPILVSKYLSVNISEAAQEATIIDFFRPENNISNVLSIPVTNVDSEWCSEEKESISFNEDSITQCTLKLTGEMAPKKGANFTMLCRKYQNQIFNLIYKNVSSFGSLYVSQYGNPRNNTKYWKKIETNRPFDLLKVTGESEDISFLCRNMVLEVGLKVFFARITDEISGATHQALIQKVELMFGPQLDLQFNFNEDIQVPVTVKVVFLDLSSPPGAASTTSRCENLLLLAVILAFIYNLL